MREDNGGRWVFLTAPRAGYPYPRSVTLTNESVVIEDKVSVGLRGEWSVTEYDTMTGEIRPLSTIFKDGATYITKTLYNNDSLLLRYDAAAQERAAEGEAKSPEVTRVFSLEGGVPYTLDEPNVLLLDKAKWSVGDGYHKRCDLDIATARAHKALGLPRYRTDLQPWLRKPETDKAKLTLLFEVKSEIETDAHFACEYKDYVLTVNGERVTAAPDGYYVDKAFFTLPIHVKAGKNEIEITIPMGKYDCAENCYLLGDFGVALSGERARLVPLPETLSFYDINKQKLPFYSGKITYHCEFVSNGEKATVSARYASALLTLRVNDSEQDVFFAPYAATFPTEKGRNTLTITAYAHRENAFGAVHIRRKYKRSDSPSWYHKTSLPWRFRRYVLDRNGILEPPTITLEK